MVRTGSARANTTAIFNRETALSVPCEALNCITRIQIPRNGSLRPPDGTPCALVQGSGRSLSAGSNRSRSPTTLDRRAGRTIFVVTPVRRKIALIEIPLCTGEESRFDRQRKSRPHECERGQLSSAVWGGAHEPPAGFNYDVRVDPSIHCDTSRGLPRIRHLREGEGGPGGGDRIVLREAPFRRRSLHVETRDRFTWNTSGMRRTGGVHRRPRQANRSRHGSLRST
ncbi:hypothetical protein JOC45_003455 [Gordonia hydrophobica]|nr:hypothetical protein [Gordonia hydrophobica]